MTYSVWERVSASRMHVMTTYLRHGTIHKSSARGGHMYTHLMAGEGGGSVVKVRWREEGNRSVWDREGETERQGGGAGRSVCGVCVGVCVEEGNRLWVDTGGTRCVVW